MVPFWPHGLWRCLLRWIIIPKRAPITAKKYDAIVENGVMPLARDSEALRSALSCALGFSLELRYLVSSDPIAANARFIPLFPQESMSMSALYQGRALLWRSFHDARSYINGSIRQMENALKARPDIDAILISFHSVPRSDAHYRRQCEESFSLMSRAFSLPIHMAYQSQMRWGSWMGPTLQDELLVLKAQGQRCIAVYPASFIGEGLESVYEMGVELRDWAHSNGMEIVRVPCLVDQPEWIRDFANDIMSAYRMAI